MLALTGKHADGYVAKGGESTQSVKQIVSSIMTSAENSGRKLSDLDIAAYLLTQVGKTEQDALEKARKDPFVSYMLSVQDDYLYEGTGIDPMLKKPIAENYFKGNIAEASRNIKDEMLRAFTLSGTKDQVRDRILEYSKSGLNLAILQPISNAKEDVSLLLEAGSTMQL